MKEIKLYKYLKKQGYLNKKDITGMVLCKLLKQTVNKEVRTASSICCLQACQNPF